LAAIFDFSLWRAIFRIALGLLGVMAFVALLIWLCDERRANPVQFGGGGRAAEASLQPCGGRQLQ